jgi:hypothetical protein
MRGTSAAKLTAYKYVRTDKGRRYRKATFYPNGKIKPNAVVVGDVERNSQRWNAPQNVESSTEKRAVSPARN